MLQSIRLRFDPVEDRLLLGLAVTADGGHDDAHHHWLHLTRRVCARWRQDLQQMVDLSAQAPAQLDAAVRASLSAAHHEALAQQARSRPARQAAPDEPVQRPALVTRILCGRQRDDGRWVVRFELQDGPALSLTLSPATLHGLVEGLSRRVRECGWDLPEIASDRTTTPPPPAAPSHLH